VSAWASFGVALLALLQAPLLILGRRFFTKLDIFETGAIEVGFSNVGPTIGLHGTMRVVFRDVFVTDIDLTVLRGRDQAQHDFDWVAFRSGEGPTVDLPTGFMVTSTQPHRYNVVFSDFETRDQIAIAEAPVREAWVEAFVAQPPTNNDERYALYGPFSQATSM
jgi:hypothetical protein